MATEFRIEPTLDGYARYIAEEGRPSDKMLADAISSISPPLLSETHTRALLRELDPSRERRGRRRKEQVSRQDLATVLRAVTRSDVPDALVHALIQRLESGRRISDFERARPIERRIHKRKRTSMFLGLYRDCIKLAASGPPYVHSICGPAKQTGLEGLPRSEVALRLTHHFSSRLGFDPPSLGRLQNLVRK